MSFNPICHSSLQYSCHGTAEIAKYKACDSNQTTIEITEKSNTNKRPKTTTYIFFGHLQAEYEHFNIEKVENGLKDKLSAFTQTTHSLPRAHGR